MNRKRNTKRRTGGKPRKSKLLAVKAFLATGAILVLSALGLWRCLDTDDADPSDAGRPMLSVTSVDVGEGQTADPTLVNEDRLLAQEKAPPQPEIPPPPSEPEKEEPEEAPIEKAQYPLYGVAYHFHTQIKSAPKSDARTIGYARRGATFRLSNKISTRECEGGWYEIEPGNTFICRGQGVIVGDEPVTFAPAPSAPNLDKPLPYRYAYVASDNTPEYWRIPTDEETKTVEELFKKTAKSLVEADTGDTDTPAPTSEATDNASSPSKTVRRPVDDPDDGDAPGAEENGTGAAADAPSQDTGPHELPKYVHLRMAKGYYVSADDIVKENGLRYQRTIRGRFIPADRLAPADPSRFRGTLLGTRKQLPRVFVAGGGVKLLRRLRADGPLQNQDPVERLSDWPYLGEISHRNRNYIQVKRDHFLPSRVASIARPVEPPHDLQPEERWIDIDLSEQILVAYEGSKPVFATLVSTGREGFETPTGTFRIYAKHVTITMDDTEAGEEAYSIEDVPWVQYFEESFALHAAFWHNRFGRVRSHGCVNLSPADARRLFFWTGPILPSGIHGIMASEDNAGTRVVIHD